MIEKIRGDLIQALSKGLMHQLGNLANGISVNLQILSKMGLKTERSEDFLKRMMPHSQDLNEMVFWMRELFLGRLERVSENFLEKIKDFLQYHLIQEKKRKIEISWEQVQTPFFQILLPILVFQEFQPSSNCECIRAKETRKGHLEVGFDPSGPSENLLRYLETREISCRRKDTVIEIKEQK